jgi:hypothetical protein
MPPNHRSSVSIRFQDRRQDLVRRGLGLVEPDRHRLPLCDRVDRFLRTRDEHAAALRNLGLVVVLPARPAEFEHALSFGEGRGRIRIGIDEDVAVIERGDQLDLLRQEHAVAEDVARHVADTDHGEGLGLDVLVHLAEVAFHRFPGAAGRDAHLLVVVTGRAARREGVVEPEAHLLARWRWRYRRRSPFPCRPRPRNRGRRRHGEPWPWAAHRVAVQRVGDRQQRAR